MLSATAGLAVASGVTGDGSRGAREPASDAQPATEPQVTARTKNPNGGRDLGVVLYRNSSGQACAASGEVSGDRVGGSGPDGFEPLPLGEGGACGGVPDPITVAVARNVQTDTATIWGRATADVESIQARTSGRKLTVPLQARETYIATIDHFDGGSVTLEIRMRSGATRTVRTSPFPRKFTEDDFARMRKEAAEQRAGGSHEGP
ncbi:MAG TPA: hypothetical protein VM266_08950 [Solirubrobacteraceae bacterium]|nr:hypothetical protein [Solirubrobacteraceae bacterium]